ncbi:restriction endonuclease subunit S, partial [Vibrio parahaemolyticus]|nr:restriction endonuclease subunit S [Vibrio parahaemolyticus]
TKKTKCVSKNEYDKHKKELSLDTILLSINGTIGSLAYYDGSSIVLGKSAAYLSPKEMIQKEFLYYYLSTSNVSKWFAMGLTGTTIKNLSLKTIRNTPIAIPHFKEQAAITSILTEVDKKVALLKAQKHETQQLKKGLMQKLLTGKWRVPVEETEAA